MSFANAWAQGPQVASISDPNGSNPFRQSGRVFTGLDIAGDSFIAETDIDLNSAAHPSVVAFSVYGSGSVYRDSDHTQLYEIGGCYHFSADNSAINQWSVWGKFQITF